MNIDSIKNYPVDSKLKHKHKQKNNMLEYKESMGVCDKKNVNRGYYSGSFTSKNGAAVKLLDSALWRVNNLCEGQTVVGQNFIALMLAAGARPLAIMALPGKKEQSWKDKVRAAAHAIASGGVGFVFSCIVMYPFDKGSKYIKKAINNFEEGNYSKISKGIADKLKQIYKVHNLRELQNSKAFKNTTKIIDMAPDTLIFGVAKACLTIAMIPPIMKFFGWDKQTSKEASGNETQQKNTAASYIPQEETTVFAKNIAEINKRFAQSDKAQQTTNGGQK